MNNILSLDLSRIYKKIQNINEFKRGYFDMAEILLQIRLNEFISKGLIIPAKNKKVPVQIPPKFPGKPLSKYLQEIRE